VFIPKYSRIITVFYGLHRNPEIFGPNVDDFDPSRWDRIKPGAWEYLPFSNGPRCCAGRDMAMNQAAFVVATVVQRYARIESRDDQPWAGKWSLTWTNGNGCKVALYET
jgi:cytochrome P450